MRCITMPSRRCRRSDAPDRADRERGRHKDRGTGLCRSDWHGWMGHDPTFAFRMCGTNWQARSRRPARVLRYRIGDRVTVPFVSVAAAASNAAPATARSVKRSSTGFHPLGLVCGILRSTLPSRTSCICPRTWIRNARARLPLRNLFPAVGRPARVKGGEWVAVHGCGGVGLSAIMIAAALGANPIAIDIWRRSSPSPGRRGRSPPSTGRERRTSRGVRNSPEWRPRLARVRSARPLPASTRSKICAGRGPARPGRAYAGGARDAADPMAQSDRP